MNSERNHGGGRPMTHGMRALERRLRDNSLDGRSAAAKLLRSIENDIADDAGGWANLTAREAILVKRCAALTLFCESVEQWALKQGSPIAADGGMLAALRKGYIAHVNALGRGLAALGLRTARADTQHGDRCSHCRGIFDDLDAYQTHFAACRAAHEQPAAAEQDAEPVSRPADAPEGDCDAAPPDDAPASEAETR